MPAPAVAASMAHRPLQIFDPLTLPGLLYLTHTDDSVATGGGISDIADRLASYAFAQATAGNRPIENTSEFSGHTVWGFDGTTRRYLSRSGSGLAGAFNGSPALTMGVYVRMANTGTVSDFLGHAIAAGNFNDSVRHRAGIANTRYQYTITVGGLGNNYQQSLIAIPTTWVLYCVTYDGAGNAEFFLDGVSVGTGSSAHASPAGLAAVVLGQGTTSGGSPSWFVGGHFACTGQLSTSNMSALSDWYAASFA